MSLLAAAQAFTAAYAARPALVADQQGWNCVIALVADDTQDAVRVSIANGHVRALDAGHGGADVTVRASCAILLDVLELRRSPNEPYLFGELTVQGPEAHFVRLDYIATTLGPSSSNTRAHTTGVAELVATSCGTALAAVCALGLYEIQRLASGLWGLLAVLVAGAVSAALARAFTRLASVVPSGAALLAYLSRAFGRRLGLLLALPYISMTLFLVGAESTVSAELLRRRWPLPVPVLAFLFLLITWAVCRAGLRISYAVQASATWLLVAGLSGASLCALARAWSDGSLAARLLPPAPDAGALLAASAQALFLFMGFELITAQIELTDAATVGRALRHGVKVLAGVYGLLVLGFACLDSVPLATSSGVLLVPQLALAEQSAGNLGAWALIVLSLLASFTSFNGALLALSRCVAALGAQGVLPRALMRVEPRSLVPRRALLLLLTLAVVSTALVQALHLVYASLLAAAASAALAYASVAWARERAPFVEAARPARLRLAGTALAVLLGLLALGVFVDGGPARPRALAVLGGALLGAALLARRVAPQPARGREPGVAPGVERVAVS